MPEEILRYKVEIDDNEILSKLSELRGNVDKIMSGFTIGITNLDNTARENMAMVGGAVNKVSGSLRDTYSSMVFESNMGMQNSAIQYKRMSDLQDMSFGTAAGAALGFGYNPQDTLYTNSDFKSAAMHKLTNPLNYAGPLAGLGTGAIVGGLIGGPLGIAAGLATGFGADLLMNTVGAPYKNTRSMAENISQTNFLGGSLSYSGAFDVAQNIRGLKMDRNLVADGFTGGEIGDLFNTALDTGLLSGSRNPQEIQIKFEKLLKSTRRISKVLGVFNDEAMKIADGLSGSLGIGTEDVGSFVAYSAGAGKTLGLSPQQMLSAAQQGGSLASAFGGASANIFGGASASQDMVMSLKSAVREGILESSVLGRMGGVMTAAGNIQQAGLALSQANPGLQIIGNTPGVGIGNVGDYVRANVSNFGEYLDFKSGLRKNAGADAFNTVRADVNIAMDIIKKSGYSATPSRIEQVLVEQGMDANTATAIVADMSRSLEDVKTSSKEQSTAGLMEVIRTGGDPNSLETSLRLFATNMGGVIEEGITESLDALDPTTGGRLGINSFSDFEKGLPAKGYTTSRNSGSKVADGSQTITTDYYGKDDYIQKGLELFMRSTGLSEKQAKDMLSQRFKGDKNKINDFLLRSSYAVSAVARQGSPLSVFKDNMDILDQTTVDTRGFLTAFKNYSPDDNEMELRRDFQRGATLTGTNGVILSTPPVIHDGSSENRPLWVKMASKNKGDGS